MIFKDSAQIEIQGDGVLRFINRQSDFALYRIIGFTNPIIEILDYRKSGLQAIDDVLNTQDVTTFPHAFSSSAFVKVSNIQSDKLVIELSDTEEQDISSVLWIAVGIEDPIPYCDYLFYKLEPLDQERFAFISIFDNPGDKYKFAVSGQLALSDL